MTHDTLAAALLDARLPRYTSYPPANRFSSRVGPEQMRAWLGRVEDGVPISLYVHVPYCRRLCYFCACRTQGTLGNAPLDRYLDHLEREVDLVTDLLPSRPRIGALHLGGGTPTILSADRLDRLAAILRGRFALDAETEVSVEIDPTECDDARLDALVRLGTGRVSVGVQDFAPIVQEAIGRRQGLDVTRRTVEGARLRGIRSVNVDLVYGLPHQDPTRLDATLDAVLDLGPDRVALFGYAHVPWMSRRQSLVPEDALPDGRARLALAALARQRLEGAGYVSVGIDHFARPHDSMAGAARAGTLRRNFQGYTTDTAPVLLGLGPSSISRFPEGYAQTEPATGAWQRSIARGELAIVRGARLDARDRLAAAVIESLMCTGAADLDALAWAHGHALAPLLERAQDLAHDLPGIATVSGGVLRVASPAAWRLAAARFDLGLKATSGRYSMAS